MTKQKPKKFGKPKSFSKYSNADPLQKTSLLSKVFGNQKKLDDARDSFFSSYDFESNINPMRLISLLLLIRKCKENGPGGPGAPGRRFPDGFQ